MPPSPGRYFFWWPCLIGGPMSFAEKLAAAKSAAKKFQEVTVALEGDLVDLKFYRLPGVQWALEASRHPLRLDVPLDRGYGYNVPEMSLAAARLGGVLVEDGVESKLTDKEWVGLFEALTGSDANAIASAVFELNIWNPAQEVESAKKARAVTSKTSSV